MESQLVVLDAVVTDANGNAVTNLRRDDFTIEEDGVPQQIRNFDPPLAPGAVATAPTKDASGHDDWGDTPLSIIVLDALDTPFEELAYSRDQLDRYLKAQPALLPRPTVVLWLSDYGIKALTPFTRNRNDILTRVDAQKGVLPDKFMRNAALDQLSTAMAALQQVALFARGSKGSKQIVWIGRSFPGVGGQDFDKTQLDLLHRTVTSTIDQLWHSRVAIYVIDPTLQIEARMNTFSDFAGPDTISTSTDTNPFQSSFSFYALVQQSGGKYYYGYNDLNNQIASSIAQSSAVYSLSYIPSNPIRDGQYRATRVRVNDPRLHVRARMGYYPSSPSQSGGDEFETKFGLREAMLARMDFNTIGMRIDRCQLDASRMATQCDVVLDNHTLTLSSTESGQEQTGIVAVIAALNNRSALIANHAFRLGLRVADRRTSRSFTTIHLQLQLPRNAKALRIAVQDASGRIGTADLDPDRVKQLLAAMPRKTRKS